jgi:hypothetical protein
MEEAMDEAGLLRSCEIKSNWPLCATALRYLNVRAEAESIGSGTATNAARAPLREIRVGNHA